MISLRSIFLFLLLSITQTQSPAQGMQHKPGLMLTGALTNGKDQLAAEKQLMADAELSMQFKNLSVTDNAAVPPSNRKNDFYSWSPYLWPNPKTKDGYPYIGKDGETNPETEARSDKPLLRKMAVAVQTLALAYNYSNDIKYAKKAVDLIRTWFLDSATKMNPNMDYGQCTPGIEKGTSTGIIDSRWFILVTDVVGLLRESTALNAKEEQGLKNWFKEYLNWLLTSELGREDGQKKNNHATWYTAQIACYALFTGDRPLAGKIVRSGFHFFDTQVDSLGGQVFELSRTKSFDYSLYNVHALITLALIGEQVDVDLWHYNLNKNSNKNLKRSIEYLAGFSYGDKKWPFQQIAEKAISLNYEDGDHFSVYYPYDMYSALRIAYKVYRDPVFLEQINKLPGNIKTNRSNLLIDIHYERPVKR